MKPKQPSPSMTQVLSDLKSRGLAKTNRYGMLIPAPVGMPPMEGVVDSNWWSQFSIEATQMPGFNVATQDNYIYHVNQKMPYMVNYDEIQLTIRCDALYSERKFFEAWKNLIKNPHTGNIRYKKDYTVDLYIEQHDDNGNVLFGVVVLNAYPIQVGDLDFQSQEVNFHRMNVSFAYDKYVTYDDLNWDMVFDALEVDGGAEYEDFQHRDATVKREVKGDADYKAAQKKASARPHATTPKGDTEYKRYQRRGETPMQMLRHASNASNYAKSRLRSIITGFLPSL